MVKHEVEKAIKGSQKWVLKKYCTSKRKRATRYTSALHHELSYLVEKGTLLHLAVLYNKPDMVKYLLSKGFDINARASAAYRISYRVGINLATEVTPLQLAVLLYRTAVMKVLMARGADLHATANGERLLATQGRVVDGTLAHMCVLWGRVDALAYILKVEPSLASAPAREVFRLGMPTGHRYAIKEAPPLHLAVLFNHEASLEELVVYVTDTSTTCRIAHIHSDARDKHGDLRELDYAYGSKLYTAAEVAGKLDHTTCADLLLDRKRLKKLRSKPSARLAALERREKSSKNLRNRVYEEEDSSEHLGREGTVRHRARRRSSSSSSSSSSSGSSSGDASSSTSSAPPPAEYRRKKVAKHVHKVDSNDDSVSLDEEVVTTTSRRKKRRSSKGSPGVEATTTVKKKRRKKKADGSVEATTTTKTTSTEKKKKRRRRTSSK